MIFVEILGITIILVGIYLLYISIVKYFIVLHNKNYKLHYMKFIKQKSSGRIKFKDEDIEIVISPWSNDIPSREKPLKVYYNENNNKFYQMCKLERFFTIAFGIIILLLGLFIILVR